ncbi:MAG: hypothetical protein HUJ22_06490 [Gracilimonas sp.]|uniref:DUF5777 family beta-barrel protein n=1 Tax=Gracilimonas sp. TaxID=1974203 RepID=UPI0019B8A504|nr:DUF5777 family beta-barrel protein [Gracilimonas sp.]MBD3616207.1 hypothetical protein [Gracilimonas sp.]
MKQLHILSSTILNSLITVLLISVTAHAQLPRELVQSDGPVESAFWATTNIGISTVQNVDKHNLESSVVHTFGLVRGGIDTFYGLDDGANTKIGLDYGISERLSVGISRMTFNKVVDLRGKYNILRQTQSGSMPVDLAIKSSLGISTLSGLNLKFNERLSYFTSVMLARKFDRLSLQLTPMIAHFNNPAAGNPNQLFGLGTLINYKLNKRFALSAEYLPVIGERNAFSRDAMAVALNINTGGHVFQLFLTSSQWHNEQYIMANNRDEFWKGDFRFGFNIHRVFGLGGN